jgi:hypothetical protein
MPIAVGQGRSESGDSRAIVLFGREETGIEPTLATKSTLAAGPLAAGW